MQTASTVSMVVAMILIVWDGWFTRKMILHRGFSEGNPIRAFLIRFMGIDGGTIGVSLLAATGIFWANALPQQFQSRMFLNVLVSAAYIYAIYHNVQLSKR